MINKVNKAIDLLKSKFMLRFKQRVFKGKNYNVKYVLNSVSNSDDLIVVFTACTKVGQPARYNYVRTLDKYKCNKIFILDDFGFDNRGAYYLGKNKDFAIQNDVELLIHKVIKDLNVKRSIFVGSSKGGYAAMYFGMSIKNSIIISGAPQYMLGDYLNLPGHQNILSYIMGDTEKTSVEQLNKVMKTRIDTNRDNNNLVYLHYSINDETYESDIKYLVNHLDTLGINTIKDIKEYMSHSELTKFFPTFIRETLDEKLL